MKNILLVGVGGQGTILMSKILSLGLVEIGYDVKMSEIHGMSQRGGSVSTMVRYGDKVFSPLIERGEADIIVSFEKVEALRALSFLKNGGTIVVDDREIYSLPVLLGAAEYPHSAIDELKKCTENVLVISAAKVCEELGNIKCQNICLLGALVKRLGLENVDWKKIISENVPAKAIEINLRAFEAGFGM